MKRIFLIAILFVMLLTLPACRSLRTVDLTGHFAPYCILDQNVPFADNLHTHQWDYVELLEQDDFGRQYYSYTTPSRSFACDLEIHVICQNVTDDEQYGYYQDKCYMIRKQSDAPFTEDAVSSFKERNEWNVPPAYEKMSYTNLEEYNTWIAWERDVSDELLKYLKLENVFVIVNAMELISDNEQLYFAYVGSQEDSEQEQLGAYLLLYKKNALNPIVICQKIEMDPNCQDVVSAFRKAIEERMP